MDTGNGENKTNRRKIALNLPLDLKQDEMSDPMQVMADFFDAYDLEDVRTILWLMMGTMLCQSDEDLSEGVSRATYLMYYEQIVRLIESTFLYCQRKGKLKRHRL